MSSKNYEENGHEHPYTNLVVHTLQEVGVDLKVSM